MFALTLLRKLFRGNGAVTSYGFDAASRLTALTQDLAGTANDLTATLGYNPAGQITSRSSSNDGYAFTGAYNVDRSYEVNGLNQLTSAGATALGYDARGNLTSSGSSAYSYTSENRMAVGAGVGLAYDPLDRLFNVTESGVNTTLLYDGADVIAEVDQNNGAAALRRYVHGPGSDEPLVWYEGAGLGDRRWLHADERGSVVAVTNAAGNATAINRYDEFGIPQTGNIGRFQYTGQKWLPSVGMYDYKARMYSPTLGRFLQTDPIGYGDGLNWYNYVGGDPVNLIDPSGLDSVCGPGKRISYVNLRFPAVSTTDEFAIIARGGKCVDDSSGPDNSSLSNYLYINDIIESLTQQPSLPWGGDSEEQQSSVVCRIANTVFNGGKGTLQLGVAGTGQLGPGAGTGGAGVAVDRQGNVGVYSFIGYGAGWGAYIGGGGSAQISNANGIDNLSGGFANASGSGGIGGSASADVFTGPSAGGPVAGGGATLGGGAGLGGFVGATFTGVASLFNIKSALGC